MTFIVTIVEGHGEIEAVPIILHRIAQKLGATLRVNSPIRVKSASFLNNDNYFSRMINLASAKAIQNNGCVLILLDCEDDCPATLGPELLNRAKQVRGDAKISVALLYREYETIFVTAARSLRERFGLPRDLEPPNDPTAIRDAKGWLGQRMNVAYDPIIHQREFSRVFDIDEAKNNPSFNRLCRVAGTLLAD